jgi:uncharacterized membrane protein
MSARSLTYAVVGLSLVIELLILAPPFVTTEWKYALMIGFAPFCHQIPARSFSIDGVALAVCHRCFGVYTGILLTMVWAVFLGGLAWAGRIDFFGRARWYLIAVLVPLGVDWFGGYSGLWSTSPASRLTTGLLFGAVAGLLLTIALSKFGASGQTRARSPDALT